MRIFEQLAQDLRHAARAMRRDRGFTTVAIATLALGIAATVTVYSFVDAIFLRRLPAPIAAGDRLVRVQWREPSGRYDSQIGLRGAEYLRLHVPSFDLVASHYSTAPFFVRLGDASREVQGAVVSSQYFPLLGVTPRVGRFFGAAEDSVPDRDAVAVISYALWQSQFAGATNIVGASLTINGRLFQVIGVAPQDFAGVLPGQATNDIWIPTAMLRVGYRWCDAFSSASSCLVTDVLARLAPTASLTRARLELNAVATRLRAEVDPTDSLRTIDASPAVGVPEISRPTYRGLAQLLTAIAAMLLTVASANVGGLLLARGIARQREILMRAALGAGRARLIRQLLTESLLLSLIGGALGTLLSTWVTSRLMSFFMNDSEGYAHPFSLSLDLRSLAFGLSASLVTVLAFGLLPAVLASRPDLTTLVKRANALGDRSRIRMVLVSAQVALSMVLLVGAGLLVRSSVNILRWNSFDPAGVTLLRVRPRLAGYTPARAQAFLRQAVTRLQQLPDVERVALARGVGVVWKSTDQIPVSLPGDVARAEHDRTLIDYHEVSPGFFATLRVPLLAGREFMEGDSAGMPRVAVVTERLAKRLWPQGQALDQIVRLDSADFRVVGIVRDYRFGDEGGASPAMAFVPFWQNAFEPQVDARLAVRVKGDPSAAIPMLRRAISSVDPDVPITETLSLQAQILASFNQVRLGSAVLVAAGGLALFLSAIGLYGVMSFIVARGTREIGIRLAVGADARDVMLDFLRRAGFATLLGAVAGIVVALAVGRLLSSWLMGVSPTDLVSFASAAVIVGAVAFIASFVPARRAARTDPAVAMHSE